MNSLFAIFFYLFFSFLLASVPISPRVLTEPSTLLTLVHDTSFRRLIHLFRFYSALLHSEPFAIVGFLSSYLPQYLCHRRSILLYTPHVSTQIPQQVLVNTPSSLTHHPSTLHRQKTAPVKID